MDAKRERASGAMHDAGAARELRRAVVRGAALVAGAALWLGCSSTAVSSQDAQTAVRQSLDPGEQHAAVLPK